MMRTFFLVLLSLVVCGGARAQGWTQDLAVVGATVYRSPDAEPLRDATVLIRAGKIAAVGKGVTVPAGVATLPCDGCVVFAGFWNNHVHFIESKWVDAEHQPAAKLTEQMQAMLTHSGFTTVVDTAALSLNNTVALRKRVDAGEVLGPRIYTAGLGLFPPHALPFYLNGMPPEVLKEQPQPETPAEAKAAVDRNIEAGSDIVKLFVGSYLTPQKVVVMPLPLARAAADEGHAHGQLVFAHPSNAAGVRRAMEAGVDVLAHAPDTVDGVDDALLRELAAHHMAMIPTLKLFSPSSDIPQIRAIVARFHALGGQLMYGTDTGYLTDYDQSEEYKQLGLTGLSFREVLAMLTTAPAGRFHVGDRVGQVKVGMDGDLTVLSADPAVSGMAAFTRVRYAVRGGRVIYSGQ
ncbi:amidohydrolase family protein [Granulicella arctica]|uniref:Imidazolonepropionase-like amidohydrolase n=1 Tax=Granulicella arctica TaxID=940613 RepID=A0A7Y9PEW6_9BACT|nr:amidohydrolase family protein [Granulicella arctica]NYF78646.1 imidazolonepropionase-like amidohydrolase [Granulicella arctica]